MYQITVEQHFDAAHALRGYQGKCENLHGHRFRVVARLRTSKLNEIGLAFDFRDLKARLAEVLERFDHTNLNEVAPFNTINPSSENIAATVYNELQKTLPGVRLFSVEVWESPDSAAEYRPSMQLLRSEDGGPGLSA
jgi:6-pyruvoyltetrahydropterin/6-carboxytetrahydropterin synthase